MADVPTPEVPKTLIGALAIAVSALAGTIVYLWRFYQGRMSKADKTRRLLDETHAKEREAWAVERTSTHESFETERAHLRLEFEEKHRILVEDYLKKAQDLYQLSREDQRAARKEFAEIMEIVSKEATKSSEKIATVLEKFYDRFVGPRRNY